MITSVAAKKIFPAVVYVVIVSMIASGLGFLFFFDAPQALAQPNVPEEATWMTDGTVYATAISGGKVYLGGAFAHVHPYTGRGVPLNKSSGEALASFPKIHSNVVQTVVPDGSGGWYIGGVFSEVGGVTRNNIAHILSNGSVDSSWNPNANGFVYSIVISGSTMYVGGTFTNIGGAARNRIAALNLSTGLATAWDPNASGLFFAIVSTIAVSGSTVYAGGTFTNIGGQARNNIAAIDATTGNATVWNPDVDNSVRTLVIDGSTVYAGGDFNTVNGGTTRNYVAAFDASGTATSWDPNADNSVYDLVISGSTIYAAGWFANIGGQARNSIAALNNTNGNATAWDPNATGGYALKMVIDGSTMYVGGGFDSIGGQIRNCIASLDLSTGNATSWNPYADSGVSTIGISDSSVYIGGYLSGVGGYYRNNIAAFNEATGAATLWNPNANNEVNSITVDGSTVYVGGIFSNIGGQARNRIAAISATTGNATAWDPDADAYVKRIIVSGSTVYVGGAFTNIGGAARNYIAALDAGTGNATVWDPNADNWVYSMALSGSTLYAGGYFTNIGGQARDYIVALDTTTGNATAWDPDSDGTVNALAVSGSTVYAGGTFDNIGGQARNDLAALNISTGAATAWNPNPDLYVDSIAINGSTIYVGGWFTFIGGQARNYLAALDATTGNATSWNADISCCARVWAVANDGSVVFAGGAFGYFNSWTRTRVGFAQFGSNPKMKDTLSRLKINTAANHTIELTLNSGVDWDAGDTLTLTLQSNFNLGALSSADAKDYDISTGVEETIVANGGCGASDAIEITSIAGQIITFTACGSYTPPGSNSTITIEIGTNATTGATGDSQITNPTIAGSYTVSFAGTLGDSNSCMVAIVDDDSVIITANVDPTFTFFISSDACGLGALDTVSVKTCNYYLAVGTNATSGAKITIQAISDGTNAKLNSDANPADDIDDITDDTTVTTGAEGYGIALAGGSAWTEVNNVGYNFAVDDTPIPSALKEILSVTGPVADTVGNRSTVTHRAAISATSPAGLYSQTVEYIATGTF